jgi:RHS repeat-associated protein
VPASPGDGCPLGWPVETARYAGDGARVDLVRRGFDPLGHTSLVRRFADPIGATGEVAWSRRVDSHGNVLRLTEPGTTPLTYSYDEWGNLVGTSRSDGSWRRSTRHRYDGFSRPISTEVLRTRWTIPVETVVESTERFHYDAHSGSSHQPASDVRGRLSRIEAVGVGDTWFSYDAFGRTATETHVMEGHGQPMRTSQLYYPGGALAELGFDTPAGVDRVQYGLDSAARTRTIAQVGGATLFTADEVDALGRHHQVTLGNGVVETFSFAAGGRRELTMWKATTAAGARRHDYLARDGDGRLTAERFEHDGATIDVTHAYDVLGRVFRSRSIGPTAATSSDELFSYDPLGNVTGKRDLYQWTQNRDYTYDATDRDRLCRLDPVGQTGTGCTFSYDVAGNVVGDTASGTRSFTDDAASRVTSVARGAWAASFVYGPGGGLARTEVTYYGGLDRRIWSFGPLIEERRRPDGQTHLERRIPGPLGVVATLRTQAVAGTAVHETVYVHGDARGNRFFTKADGSFAQQTRYRAFGGVFAENAQPSQLTYSDDLWNGGDDLRELGVVALGARLYDPTLGRFLQRDPIAHTFSSAHGNPYAFAFNDPVNFTDPTGMSPCMGAEVLYCNTGLVGMLPMPRIAFGPPRSEYPTLPPLGALPIAPAPGSPSTSPAPSTLDNILGGIGDAFTVLGTSVVDTVERSLECAVITPVGCVVQDAVGGGEAVVRVAEDPRGAAMQVFCDDSGCFGTRRMAMLGTLVVIEVAASKGKVFTTMHVPNPARALPAGHVPKAPPAGGAGGRRGPRFVADDMGNVVDTQATPPGRYIQPDRSATDILQQAEHPGLDPFTSRTHTHPAEVHINPRNPAQGATRLGDPRPVTTDEVKNIKEGKAKPSRRRGR